MFTKILAVMAFGLVASSAFADGGIHIKDAWVKAAPPGVKVLAAYMEINNSGDKPQVITGVSSPAFGSVEIHRSVIHNNMAHMEHLKELAIPAKGSAVLQQGGLHLMLMEAKKPLRSGDKVDMTFTLGSGEKIAVTAEVRSGKMGGMDDRQQMDHSNHDKHMH